MWKCEGEIIRNKHHLSGWPGPYALVRAPSARPSVCPSALPPVSPFARPPPPMHARLSVHPPARSFIHPPVPARHLPSSGRLPIGKSGKDSQNESPSCRKIGENVGSVLISGKHILLTFFDSFWQFSHVPKTCCFWCCFAYFPLLVNRQLVVLSTFW